MPGYMDVFIYGDTAGVQAMLLHMQTKLAPPAIGAFLQTVVDPYLRGRVSERFDSEGDDVTGRWAPLGAATQAIRQQQGFGASSPINERTGEMKDYLLNTPSSLSFNPIGATLTYPGMLPGGELLDKLNTAQNGRTTPPTVPRPVLGVNTTDLAAVLASMAYYIQGP